MRKRSISNFFHRICCNGPYAVIVESQIEGKPHDKKIKLFNSYKEALDFSQTSCNTTLVNFIQDGTIKNLDGDFKFVKKETVCYLYAQNIRLKWEIIKVI